MKVKHVTLTFLIISAILFHWSCSPDEKTLTAPFDDLSEFLTIANFTAGTTQLIANTDTTTVSATILNSDEDPVASVPVTFTATSGEIIYADSSGYALTDVLGVAQARYTPSADYGNAQIFVQGF